MTDTTTDQDTTDVDASTEDSSESWVTPEVRAALDFDPFTPEEDEVKPAPAENPEEPPAPADAQTDAALTPPVEPTPAAPVQYTQEQVDALLSAAKAQQPIQQPQPTEAADPLTTIPEYDFAVPDQLVDMLGSEDPVTRKTAVAHLIKGVAVGIHQTLAQAVTAKLTQLEQNLPKTVYTNLAYSQQEQAVRTDFYGKYPQLNTPELRKVVHDVAKAHMEATNSWQWNEKLRDEVGTLVLQKLAAALPQQQPAPVAANPQPAMFGGAASSGNARAATPGPKTQADHMADLFDF